MKKTNMGNNPTKPTMGAFQLTEGMSAEMMQPIFFNKNALREPSVRLYQLNTKGTRYYYYFDEDGNPIFMPSVTTVLRHTMPENVFLTDWKIGMGKEKAEAYTAERAAYGTFYHSCIERLIINKGYNLDELKTELAKYIEREQLPSSFINYADSLKRDLLAFAQWMYEYDVVPYAVEISLYSERYGFAGMIDLVANIRKYPRSEEKKVRDKWAEDSVKAAGDDKKLAKLGEKLAEIEQKFSERENAIIDFKSGKKGFYEEHEIQLGMYRMLWEGWFSEIQIDSLYNFAPKDWRSKPTFAFKNQTDAPSLEKIPYLLGLYALVDDSEKDITLVGGNIDMQALNPTESCIKVISMAELVKEKEATPQEDDKPLFEEE